MSQQKMASMPALGLGGFPGQPPGAEPPKVSPNAAAVQCSFNLYFADGDSMTMNPPAVGTESGDPDELCTELDRVCGEIKELIRLKYSHRINQQAQVEP